MAESVEQAVGGTRGRRVRTIGVAGGIVAAAVLAAACSGSGSGGKSGPQDTGSGSGSGPAVANSSSAHVVSGGTFSFALPADPGNLDPQASAATNLYQMSFFAYDPLLSIDNSGKIGPQLVSSWKVQGTTVTLTMHKNVTCSDGSAFTAQTAADNINFVTNPKNKSPFAGVFIPAGAKAKADEAAGTVTLTLAAPAPFVLNGLAGVPMVCGKGLANRSMLAHKTDGTGPYVLSTAVANDHYTFTKRSGYDWGPNGASTSAAGLPNSLNIRIIPNETTAANLVLSGQLNGATILGADVQRLEAAKLFEVGTPALAGEMWFNQGSGRPGADEKVRLALTQALDLAQVQKVYTSGRGTAGTTLAVAPPQACPGDSASAIPSHDVNAAKAMLDADGWKAGADGIRSKNGKQLAMTFLYGTESGAAGSAAAEFAASQWKQLGVKVTLKGETETNAVATLFQTGNWDIAWEPVNVSSPDQIVGFVSGPPTPNGENFAHINNSAYNAAVAKAEKTAGTAGCSQWLSAEQNLFRSADVIPFANTVGRTFGKGAQFAIVGGELQPTSIRMTS